MTEIEPFRTDTSRSYDENIVAELDLSKAQANLLWRILRNLKVEITIGYGKNDFVADHDPEKTGEKLAIWLTVSWDPNETGGSLCLDAIKLSECIEDLVGYSDHWVEALKELRDVIDVEIQTQAPEENATTAAAEIL